jgi:hypothetical protein
VVTVPAEKGVSAGSNGLINPACVFFQASACCLPSAMEMATA